MSLLITLPVSLIVGKIFQSVRHTERTEPQSFHEITAAEGAEDIEMQQIQRSGLALYHASIFDEGICG